VPADEGAPVEPTHLGKVMDVRVARAKRRVRTDGDADYDLVRHNFDFLHYLLQAPAVIDQPKIDVVQDFLDRSLEEDTSPHPDFSMRRYLQRHPERADGPVHPYVAWLRSGRDAGEIADPAPGLELAAEVLDLKPLELVDQLSEVRAGLSERFRTGKLGEMFARAAEVEPLIGAAWARATSPNIPPAVAPYVVHQVAAVQDCQRQAGFRRARVLMVINRPRWGGGRRMEGHLAHALARHIDPSEIVVIYTEESGNTPGGRFPAGVREVDFAAASEPMGRWVAQRALVELVRSFHADVVLNINSRLLYESMASFGQALAATERLFPVFFCGEKTARGNWMGYPFRHFYRNADICTGLVTDSEHWRDWFRDQYLLDDEHAAKLHVFRAPVDPSLPAAELREQPQRRFRRRRRPNVFWAGRWDRQKRIDLVVDIARRMPDVDFSMWGEAVLERDVIGGDLPTNVTLKGRYDHITDLDLGAADAWLYTSGWDGVPSQLLEVGMTGVPIVGTLVGGTGEVLAHGHAWGVPLEEGAASYEKAIRDVLADPVDARRRALQLRERLLRERSQEEFAAHVVPLLLGEQGEEESTS
jgi:glycosyltransferase involved in cell wall biosynthesis